MPPAARAFRLLHGAITVAFLGAIAHVWRCALSGRRDRALGVAIVALSAEATAVTLNHGDCPLGPFAARLGDDVPLFELVLSPRAAQRAVPVLGAIAFAGIALVAISPRRGSGSAAAVDRRGAARSRRARRCRRA